MLPDVPYVNMPVSTHSPDGSTFNMAIAKLSLIWHRSGNVVVWFSGNALVSIDVVVLRRAQLVLGWVTFTSLHPLGI